MSEPQSVDDGGRRVVEVEARTVDEAVARGLVRLGGLSRAEVKIEIQSEGRGGLLGFGAEQAIVRLTELLPGEEADDIPSSIPEEPEEVSPEREPRGEPEPRKEAEEAEEAAERQEPVAEPEPPRRREVAADGEAAEVAQEIVGELLRLLGYESAVIELKETLLPVSIEGESSVVLSISGKGVDRLLSQDSRPLYALQFLARLVVGRRIDNWVNLLLDVDGDRARRMKELFQLAEQSATLVEREGLPVSLPPMTAYERRVVHLALREHPNVVTQSIGSGDSRKVTVRRKDQVLPEL